MNTRIKKITRIFFDLSLLFFAASFATNYLGHKYAIRQAYPQGVPTGAYIDFIGFEWSVLAGGLMVMALVLVFFAFVSWVFSVHLKQGRLQD